MSFHHHPKLEIERAAIDAMAEERVLSAKERFRDASAEQKRNGAERSLSMAAEYRRSAAPAGPDAVKAEVLEKEADWLIRSADWQDFRGKVKRALHIA